MAIPSISAYALPTASDMPENKVSWTLNPKRAVLLIHDMQNYFVDAFAKGEAPITEASQNIKKIKEQCKALGIPVVYTAQPGDQDPADRAAADGFLGAGAKKAGLMKKRSFRSLPRMIRTLSSQSGDTARLNGRISLRSCVKAAETSS